MHFCTFSKTSWNIDGFGSWIKSNKRCAHQIKEWDGENWQSKWFRSSFDYFRLYIPPAMFLKQGILGQADSEHWETNRRLLYKIRKALRKEGKKSRKKRKHFASGSELKKWLRTSFPITDEKFDEFFRGVVIPDDIEEIFIGIL